MTKERSRAYPAIDLATAYGLLRQPLMGVGTEELERKEVACRLGYATGDGGIAARKIAALAHYGLLERLPLGRYRLSRRGLFVQNLRPENPRLQSALQEILGQPVLFRQLLERYWGADRIPADLPRVLTTEYGITAKASVEAATVFLRSARFAGLLSPEGALASVEGDSGEEGLAAAQPREVPQLGMDTAATDLPVLSNDRLELRLTHRKSAWLEIPPSMTARDLEILIERLDLEVRRLGEYLGIERAGEGKLRLIRSPLPR